MCVFVTVYESTVSTSGGGGTEEGDLSVSQCVAAFPEDAFKGDAFKGDLDTAVSQYLSHVKDLGYREKEKLKKEQGTTGVKDHSLLAVKFQLHPEEIKPRDEEDVEEEEIDEVIENKEAEVTITGDSVDNPLYLTLSQCSSGVELHHFYENGLVNRDDEHIYENVENSGAEDEDEHEEEEDEDVVKGEHVYDTLPQHKPHVPPKPDFLSQLAARQSEPIKRAWSPFVALSVDTNNHTPPATSDSSLSSPDSGHNNTTTNTTNTSFLPRGTLILEGSETSDLGSSGGEYDVGSVEDWPLPPTPPPGEDDLITKSEPLPPPPPEIALQQLEEEVQRQEKQEKKRVKREPSIHQEGRQVEAVNTRLASLQQQQQEVRKEPRIIQVEDEEFEDCDTPAIRHSVIIELKDSCPSVPHSIKPSDIRGRTGPRRSNSLKTTGVFRKSSAPGKVTRRESLSTIFPSLQEQLRQTHAPHISTGTPTYARLTQVTLTDTNDSNTNLTTSRFTTSNNLTDAKVTDTTKIFSTKVARDTKLNETKLSNTKLNETKLRDTKLNDTQSNDTNIVDIKFTDIQNTDKKFTDSKFTDTHLTNTNITDTALIDRENTNDKITIDTFEDTKLDHIKLEDSKLEEDKLEDYKVEETKYTNLTICTSADIDIKHPTETNPSGPTFTDIQVPCSPLADIDFPPPPFFDSITPLPDNETPVDSSSNSNLQATTTHGNSELLPTSLTDDKLPESIDNDVCFPPPPPLSDIIPITSTFADLASIIAEVAATKLRGAPKPKEPKVIKPHLKRPTYKLIAPKVAVPKKEKPTNFSFLEPVEDKTSKVIEISDDGSWATKEKLMDADSTMAQNTQPDIDPFTGNPITLPAPELNGNIIAAPPSQFQTNDGMDGVYMANIISTHSGPSSLASTAPDSLLGLDYSHNIEASYNITPAPETIPEEPLNTDDGDDKESPSHRNLGAAIMEEYEVELQRKKDSMNLPEVSMLEFGDSARDLEEQRRSVIKQMTVKAKRKDTWIKTFNMHDQGKEQTLPIAPTRVRRKNSPTRPTHDTTFHESTTTITTTTNNNNNNNTTTQSSPGNDVWKESEEIPPKEDLQSEPILPPKTSRKKKKTTEPQQQQATQEPEEPVITPKNTENLAALFSSSTTTTTKNSDEQKSVTTHNSPSKNVKVITTTTTNNNNNNNTLEASKVNPSAVLIPETQTHLQTTTFTHVNTKETNPQLEKEKEEDIIVKEKNEINLVYGTATPSPPSPPPPPPPPPPVVEEELKDEVEVMLESATVIPEPIVPIDVPIPAPILDPIVVPIPDPILDPIPAPLLDPIPAPLLDPSDVPTPAPILAPVPAPVPAPILAPTPVVLPGSILAPAPYNAPTPVYAPSNDLTPASAPIPTLVPVLNPVPLPSTPVSLPITPTTTTTTTTTDITTSLDPIKTTTTTNNNNNTEVQLNDEDWE
ncbi:hypothetical protein Pmani_029237 [Petrolisthes manimaculis]|uniref:Uncharacterized protein n=1 Tax=Petrolisthes manimaculis TaxID=1843537 RepID=A0AAE1NXZ5_9EUCA|nr:hypothetical protein Pmani_029237 [Petrolisthes manimaculis]